MTEPLHPPPPHVLRAIGRALLPLAAIAFLLDGALGLTLGPLATQATHSPLSSPENLRAIATRLNAVQAELAAAPAAGPPLAVVLGLSTAREGIEPGRFELASGQRYRLLNLAASGGSYGELADYCAPLLASGLRPALIIVGLHPSWLAGRVAPPAGTPSPGALDRATARERLRRLQAWLVQRSWILANRVVIHERLGAAMSTLRRRIGALLRVAALDAPPWAADPWTVERQYADTRADDDFRALQLEQWAAMGWFDPARLHAATPDGRQLHALLHRLRAMSPRLVVVLMPEAQAFRTRVPASGAQAIGAIAASVDPGIVVLDLRDRLPETAFRDQAHLNADGSGQVSELLARKLAP